MEKVKKLYEDELRALFMSLRKVLVGSDDYRRIQEDIRYLQEQYRELLEDERKAKSLDLEEKKVIANERIEQYKADMSAKAKKKESSGKGIVLSAITGVAVPLISGWYNWKQYGNAFETALEFEKTGVFTSRASGGLLSGLKPPAKLL